MLMSPISSFWAHRKGPFPSFPCLRLGSYGRLLVLVNKRQLDVIYTIFITIKHSEKILHTFHLCSPFLHSSFLSYSSFPPSPSLSGSGLSWAPRQARWAAALR